MEAYRIAMDPAVHDPRLAALADAIIDVLAAHEARGLSRADVCQAALAVLIGATLADVPPPRWASRGAWLVTCLRDTTRRTIHRLRAEQVLH